MTDHELPLEQIQALGKAHGCFVYTQKHWYGSTYGANHVAFAHAVTDAALAPLLEDLAAHEASNHIKTENLETLRAENGKLRAALAGLVKINEEHDAAVAGIVGSPLNWKDDYLDAARAALGESDESKHAI